MVVKKIFESFKWSHLGTLNKIKKKVWHEKHPKKGNKAFICTQNFISIASPVFLLFLIFDKQRRILPRNFSVKTWACHCCVVNSSSFTLFSLSLPHPDTVSSAAAVALLLQKKETLLNIFTPSLDSMKKRRGGKIEMKVEGKCYEHGAGCCCVLYIKRVPFFRMRAPFPLLSRLIFCPWDFW